jgi:hypothetical protein
VCKVWGRRIGDCCVLVFVSLCVVLLLCVEVTLSVWCGMCVGV